jgi:hypothetical protein
MGGTPDFQSITTLRRKIGAGTKIALAGFTIYIAPLFMTFALSIFGHKSMYSEGTDRGTSLALLLRYLPREGVPGRSRRR